MKVSYQAFKPSLALQPFVDGYWLQVLNGDGLEVSPVQKCLPLGMVQFIIHVNRQECHVQENGEWKKLPDTFCVGLYSEPAIWRCVGKTVVFGIDIKPESVLRLFKVPVASLFNQYTEIDSFLGKKVQVLADRLIGIEDVKEMISITEAFFHERIKDVNAERNYLFEATQLIRQAKGGISVEKLSKSLYVSERQLQRSFKEAFGTTPKTYTRIIRFRHAYQHIRHAKNQSLSWANLSYTHGYSDQAHFIRDFKEFAGTIPTAVLDNSSQEFYQMNQELIY